MVGTCDGRLADSLLGSLMNRRTFGVSGAPGSESCLGKLPVQGRGMALCDRGSKTSEGILGMLTIVINRTSDSALDDGQPPRHVLARTKGQIHDVKNLIFNIMNLT